MQDKSKCLLCQSNEFIPVHTYSEPDKYERAVGINSAGYFRQWVQCTGCKLYYSRYSRPEDVFDQMYASIYRAKEASWRGQTTEEIFQHVVHLPLEESENKYRINWIKSQLKILWETGTVKRGIPPFNMLDIGGATGVFAYEFGDHEWIPHVIDPSKDGIFLQSKFGIFYIQKKYEPGCFNKKFDLISMIFVLEHLKDPIFMLKCCRQDMQPDSFLYLEVPDAACFNYKPPEDDIFNSCHLWMFAPDTISKLLRLSDLNIYSMQMIKTVRGHYALMLLAGLK